MSTFELLLLKNPGRPADPEKLAAALPALVEQGGPDPQRAVYRNPDSGTFFTLVLASDVARLLRARRRREAGEEEDEGEGGDDLREGGEVEEDVEDDEAGDEEDEEDDEEEGEAEAPVEETPLAMVIPLVCPAFIAREAIGFAVGLARAASLHLEHLESAVGKAGAGGAETSQPASAAPLTAETAMAAWEAARRRFVEELQAAGGMIEVGLHGTGSRVATRLTTWSPAKAEAFRKYGEARPALAASLEAEGVRVPILQTALHGGAVKTICDWETWRPALLPESDLVIVRRKKLKKGFLRTKEVVVEGIAEGARIWKLLAAKAEGRADPVSLIIFRPPDPLPQEIAAELEVLDLEPLESARRTPLIGVVDLAPEVDS